MKIDKMTENRKCLNCGKMLIRIKLKKFCCLYLTDIDIKNNPEESKNKIIDFIKIKETDNV